MNSLKATSNRYILKAFKWKWRTYHFDMVTFLSEIGYWQNSSSRESIKNKADIYLRGFHFPKANRQELNDFLILLSGLYFLFCKKRQDFMEEIKMKIYLWITSIYAQKFIWLYTTLQRLIIKNSIHLYIYTYLNTLQLYLYAIYSPEFSSSTMSTSSA